MLFLLIILTVFSKVDGNEYQKEYKESKLTDYDREVRPEQFSNNNVTVYVREFDVAQVTVDESHGSVSVIIHMHLIWSDSRLGYDKSQFNTDQIMLPSNEIWLPDISVINSVDDTSSTRSSQMYNSKRYVTIHPNGTVEVWPRGRMSFQCAFNIRKYPFDIQECEIRLASSAYSINELAIRVTDIAKGSLGSESIQGPEWSVGGDWLETRGPSYITYKLTLTRNKGYFRFAVIIPLALIGLVLTPLMFILPVRDHNKFSLGIYMFLLVTVILMVLVVTLPPTGNVTPTIVEFTAFVLLMVTVAILFEWFIIWLVSPCDVSGNQSHQLPRWLVRLARSLNDGCCCCNILTCMQKQGGDRNESVQMSGDGRVNEGLTGQEVKQVKESLQKEEGECWMVAHVMDRCCLLLYIIVFVAFTGVIHAY